MALFLRHPRRSTPRLLALAVATAASFPLPAGAGTVEADGIAPPALYVTAESTWQDDVAPLGPWLAIPHAIRGPTADLHAWDPDVAADDDPLEALAARVADLESRLKPNPPVSRPDARFTMQLQVDQYHSTQDAANIASVGEIPNGTAFRRARVGWFGSWEQTEYRIEVDFALPGRPSFLDVWAGLKGLPVVNYVRVGHFFEPFSLERLTSNRFVTFMERSLGDQPFAPARNLGIMAFDNTVDERMTWAIGLFAENSDVFGDDVGVRGRDGAVTGRVTWLPYYDEPSGGRYYLHLGTAGSARRLQDSRVRYRAQPEARLGSAVPNIPFFVDTGELAARHSLLWGGELAWTHGPLAMQSELFLDSVDLIDAGNALLLGWYAEVSYFLTGEHRPYRRRMPQGGVFDRVHPLENFYLFRTPGGPRGGWGAWQVALRLSHLDLNSGEVRGGELTDLTVGLNWYLTPYLRVTSNYVHPFLIDRDGVSSNADIFAVRVGYEF